MKLTVIFEDGVIVKDGEAKKGFDFSGYDSKWQSLQWDSVAGLGKIILNVSGDPVLLDNSSQVAELVQLYDNMPDPDDPPVEEGPPTAAMVTTERDRRVDDGFVFQNNLYQFDPASKARVTGAATLAKFAILAGAQPGNYRWMNPNLDFTWTPTDNSTVLMDAQTCSAFGDAAAIHEQTHFLAAKALKAMDPIPDDYRDNKYWPPRY
jgi:hypothetical protein